VQFSIRTGHTLRDPPACGEDRAHHARTHPEELEKMLEHPARGSAAIEHIAALGLLEHLWPDSHGLRMR